MKKKTRLIDIARECGVGTTTVSNVLNNITKGFSVKPELRDRILTVSRKLNYKPNIIAKSLRENRTGQILILGYSFNWAEHKGNIYQEILTHLINRIQDEGYLAMAAFRSGNTTPKAANLIMDGTVCLTNACLPVLKEGNNDKPYVIVNDCGRPGESWLKLDDAAAAAELMEHLYGMGHRRIMYVDETGLHWHSSKDIRSGVYCRFMQERGLQPLCHVASWGMSAQILKIAKKHKVSALVCYNSSLADLIIKDAAQTGISVPQDISVATFNGLKKEYSFTSADITAMHFPLEEIGNRAAEMILAKISGENKAVQIKYCAKLHQGETTVRISGQNK